VPDLRSLESMLHRSAATPCVVKAPLTVTAVCNYHRTFRLWQRYRHLTSDSGPQGMALICMARPLEDCTIETQSDWGYSLGVGEWKGATGHILGREIDPLTKGM